MLIRKITSAAIVYITIAQCKMRAMYIIIRKYATFEVTAYDARESVYYNIEDAIR